MTVTTPKNVFYTSVEKRGQNILLRYVKDGVRKSEKVEFKPTLYIPARGGGTPDALSMHDEPLSRVDFDSMKEAEEFIDRYKDVSGFKVYGMRTMQYQFISKHFPGEIKYDGSKINKGILDIEVFSGQVELDAEGKLVPLAGPFPHPAQAAYPISSICMYSSRTRRYHVFALEYFNGHKIGTYVHDPEDKEVGKLEVVYKGFSSERELLHAFSTYWQNEEFDIYSGWNSETFDCPYFVKRTEALCGETAVKRYSPWGFTKLKTFATSWGEEETYEFLGLPCMDYKQLVEKHGYVELENWKLETAAQHYLKEGKMSYEEAGSLNTLYVTNFQKYIKYNIRDVDLIVRMDAKLQFFDLTFTLAYITHSNYHDTLATVKPWSALAYCRLSGRGVQPELRPIYMGDINFAGGYVKEPKPGMYDWVVSADANSLYPHMMMQFNLGPETILTNNEAYEVRQKLLEELAKEELTPYIAKLKNYIAAGETLESFYWEEIYEFKVLKELNLAMAPNLSFYRKDRMSIWSELCREVYDGRKIVKKQMLVHEQELVDLKASGSYTEAEVLRLENLIASMQNLQQGYKILMNALYGALSNKWFREYFDLRVAEAITTAGQTGIQFVQKRLNDYFNKVCGTTNTQFVIAGDTDSVYLQIAPVIDKMFTKEQQAAEPGRVIDFMDKLFKSKIEPLLDQWTTELSNALNCYENKLVFKRENLATKGVWTAKKRYSLMVADSEGVRYPKPKLKFTGLEAKKSSTPKHCRAWLAECYEIAMTKTQEELQAHIKGIEAQFMSKPIEEIAAPRSVNGLEKYSDPTNIYSKGAPKHVKAALFHNNIIQKKGLNVKPIMSGDKILFVELKSRNPYNFEVMGFQSYLPKEFGLDEYVDRKYTFEKTFLDPMQNYLDAIGWATTPKASVMDFFV